MERQAALCVAIGMAIWVLQLAYNSLRSPLRHIPGPLYTRATRLPLKISIITGKRIYFIHDLHQRYGPVVRIAPDEVSISSLPEFKEIHRAGSAFLKTAWYQKTTFDRKPGIFAMRDPKEHSARRKLLARPFAKSELRRTWEPVVKEKVHLAVSQIRRELLSTGRSDVLKWWTFFATDVSGHLMFGESFGMLQLGRRTKYIDALESIMKGGGINAELPVVGLIGRHIPHPSFKAMFRSSDYLSEYGGRAVSNSRTNSMSTRNIFTGMLTESEKESGTLTEEDVVTEAGNLIVAGSDTTAVTLTYLVWAVLLQPALQHDLEEEVGRVDPSYNEAALEELPLLNAVIMETLRLYGAAPGSLPRSVPHGGGIFGGYRMPQGVTVSTQSYTIHRDETLYPDPESFDATRWLPGDGRDSDAARQGLSPFGHGSRGCLGIHLAWMELRLAAAEFFRECRGVRLAPSATWESMKPENYFLISPCGHRCEIMHG
ncbi:sterigmatocystin biosynthesis P450 monooxygenase [Aspergillus sclerotioniger CBS 115572]|uniref:Sterigmatocystin biosynthesis P450 monooxygenase n=1 Tax=Aspergillus sclerotioniger CBS 115572 TaxID=1450535 RepID=A0A317VZD8_9EURO|nr:sterigmatocystin biosynthesis P450 monooxygenase [Aspergillus sclerotioniger CBS 115572]PWY77260.1 sterigmatocystin biosynthesis P450 monooxygenase [Aspergillus sclerotioniger CBS 115572]